MTDNFFLKEFGKWVKRIREQQRLSQSELTRLSGKDRQSIYRLEKGIMNPTIFYLYEIAESLKVPLTSLLMIEQISHMKMGGFYKISLERLKRKLAFIERKKDAIQQ